jgi:hypothetical protein
MEKIAGSFAALLFLSGVAIAQTDTQQPAAMASKQADRSPGSGPIAIQHWRGTLVDASCASGGGARAAAANESSTKSEITSVDSGRPEKGHKKDSAQAQSCPVSTSTSAFALRTDSGQVMKIDAVGSARVAEALKTKSGWTKDLSAGKPIRAKVSGMLNGDTITVTSIS